MYQYAYNNKLKKVVRFERVIDLRYCDCKDLDEFISNGWSFAKTLEEVVKETVGEECEDYNETI